MPSAVRARRHPAGAQHAEVEERGRAKEERVHGLARSPPARARASERAPVSRFGRALKRGEALTSAVFSALLADRRSWNLEQCRSQWWLSAGVSYMKKRTSPHAEANVAGMPRRVSQSRRY